MMRSGKFNHGFPDDVWEAAKTEAREAMVAVAKQQSLISYTELVAEIESCELEPQDTQLAHLLGEISMAEHYAGRGMLTVVVVHKSGDQMPGPGFFELARSLRYDTADKQSFWVSELQKVYSAWSSNSGAIG